MPTYQELGFGGGAALTGDRARTVFGQVMGLVGITMGFAALGAYVARNWSGGGGIVLLIGWFGLMFAMQAAVRRGHEPLAMTLLFAFGLVGGISIAPLISYYLKADPGIVYHAAGATALFTGVLGSIGYLTRRDLSAWAKPLFIALLVGCVAGLVLIFVHSSGAVLIWSVIMLVVFAGYTVFDFNMLAKHGDQISPIIMAASIFINILNVFMLFLNIFAGGRR